MAVVGCRSSMHTAGARYATHALISRGWSRGPGPRLLAAGGLGWTLAGRLGPRGSRRCRRTPETCTCRNASRAEVPQGLARMACGCRSSPHPSQPEWPGLRGCVIRIRGGRPGRMTWASADRVERSGRDCPRGRSEQPRAVPVRVPGVGCWGIGGHPHPYQPE
jgi:hypothetical protein